MSDVLLELRTACLPDQNGRHLPGRRWAARAADEIIRLRKADHARELAEAKAEVADLRVALSHISGLATGGIFSDASPVRLRALRQIETAAEAALAKEPTHADEE